MATFVFGTRHVVHASGVLCGASLVLPDLAREPWALAAALLVAALHATFSVGGVIAALVGA